MTIEQKLNVWATKAFHRAFPDTDLGNASLEVVTTNDPRFGDYQCNAAMGLAKLLKQNPRAIAQQALDAAESHPLIDRTEIAGAGFINIHIRADELARYLETTEGDARMGAPTIGEGRTLVIDYSSPNVAKPMHIGHIRSTVIGNALDRMYRFLGYRVIADNHLGDWGTQFGLLIVGYHAFADHEALKENPVEELERIYVTSYNQSRADEAWLDQARSELVKLQQGDPEHLKLWQMFVDLSLREFDKLYKRLGVSFDLVRGESFYRDQLAGVLDQLKAAGLVEESEGAQVVKLEDEKLPLCIVQKRDGGFNYATSDLATVQQRMEEFQPESIVYVTDERQQLHFNQFFSISRKLGWNVNLVHVWFGLMRLPEGVFSTREGNVIKLERMLDEAESRALTLVQSSSPDMPEAQQRDVARAVGIGAVKYADLSQNPQSLIVFTWEKALSMEGNSAPYLQYACARISSVLDKYRDRFPDGVLENAPIQLEADVEHRLALKLVRFPEVVQRAAHQFRPNLLADYLYDLAQAYSSFYQNVPFLKAPDGVRESRLRLCRLVSRTLRAGLDLLGIETPERI